MRDMLGMSVGRFRVVHALPGRVRLTSSLLGATDFDGNYFQALLEALPGVANVRLNTRGRSIAISYDGREDTWCRIEEYLREIPQDAYHASVGEPSIRASDVLTKALLVTAAQVMPHPLKAALTWAVCLKTLSKGAETLIFRGLKVEVLDALAVGLSLIRGNYFTAGSITTLLSLSEYLEVYNEQRSAELLKSLLRPQADHLWVVRDGVEARVPAKDVLAGDLVVFGAGESVAVDGTVVEGEASVNQSSISGESVPVHIKPGDPVISGSVVDEGRLVVEVEHAGAETAVARIGRFINQSLCNKSKKQMKSAELADKLVPINLGLSAASFLATRSVSRMASVLTVDFSCAIKLTTPVTVRSGIYAAGQAGVLLKGAPAMDALQDMDTIIFDKTGTLTTGNLTVTDIIALEGLTSEELLALAAGAEEHYDHPVARAVIREAKSKEVTPPSISRVDFIVAHGVSAYIDGSTVLVGSHHFLAEDEGVPCSAMDETAKTLRSQGKSLLYVARDALLIGIIALRDEPRAEACTVLALLKEKGIKKVVVLTGDHKDTALALQRELPGIDEIYYELKPEDKARVVESLKQAGCCVGFVGDGVNDAPALVNADVGICMPRGADLAKEAAQVLLVKDDLYMIIHAREAALRTNAIIRHCFYATVACNSLTLFLAAAKGLPPAIAALMHNVSTVGVLGYAGMASSRALPQRLA